MVWLRLALIIAAFVLGGGSIPVPLQNGVGPEPAKPAPSPDRPRRPLIPRPWKPAPAVVEAAAVGGLTSPDGLEEIACDLPREFQLKNVGGTDGAGLCVWASMQHTATWQQIAAIDGVFKFMQSQRGGGWPSRVDQIVPLMAKRNGQQPPDYLQVENRDPLAMLKLACKTGRMPGVTYSYSPTGRYGGGQIAHMVSLVHASDKWFAILDNNFPGTIEWMDPATFLKVHTRNGRENGWHYTFLADPPPPPPVN